jgi:8-oxo-dGTP diphosphatase
MSAPLQPRSPRVGVGVIVTRRGLVLLGQRQGAHGAGTWALPGGHLEFGETVEECARREVAEETGLELQGITLGPYTSTLFPAEGEHYITLFALGSSEVGEAVVREPAKCIRWEWFPWSALPSPLFEPLRSLQLSGFVPDRRLGRATL